MKFTKLAAAAALATAAIPGAALAQETAVTVEAGQTVYGNDEGEIGVIKTIEGDIAVIVIDGNDAQIPAAAIAIRDNRATINITKAGLLGMLEQQRQQAAAARDQALVVGAAVSTVQGEPIGPVDSINGDKIVLKHGDSYVALMRDNFAVTNGQLVALVSMADIMAAVAANGGAAAEAEGAM